MQITLPDDPRLTEQANAAGYHSVEQYIFDLVKRDSDRVATLQGLADMNAGRGRPASEVEAELRNQAGLPPRP
jgi:hypothetical protein